MIAVFKKYRPEILGSVLCIVLGLLSGLYSDGAQSQWYLELKKPKIIPPGWVFGVVWSVLYLLMGIALGKIWKVRLFNYSLLGLFALQMLFNLLWSPLFFYYHYIHLALIDIFVLWVCLISLMTQVRMYRSIYLLLVPYILWVSFALALNYSIYRLNVVITT
ncbi:MAG: TspO/MBR family protein [Candidatus Berkiella sp.]